MTTGTDSYQYIAGLVGAEWVEKQLDKYATFRSEWSPDSRWYHRPPAVSPLVPLLYWNSLATWTGFRPPMGFWAGDPVEILDRLVQEIRAFEWYWADLPDGRGSKNLVWALTNYRRFFSLAAELATAFLINAREGVHVEPLFFDPRSTRGKPDFIAHTPSRQFAVQCKSQDPTAARQFPYDLWQFLAGVFHRLVEDSGRSYQFTIALSERLDAKRVLRMRNRLRNLIRSRLSVPYPWSTSYGEFLLMDLGVSPTEATLHRARRRAPAFQSAPVYAEIVDIPKSTDRNLASFSVFGKRGEDITEFIKKAIVTAVAEADSSDPLIVAVHLYHEIDFRHFGERPMVKDMLIPWTDQLFFLHPELALIFLSANHEEYAVRLVGDQIGLKHGRSGWAMESPVWDHADVAELGI